MGRTYRPDHYDGVKVPGFRSGFDIGILAGMLSFLLMAFLSEDDNFRYKFDIEQH